jgi:hypothetical protein
MERIPENNEVYNDELPMLYVDLQEPNGNVFELIGLTSHTIAKGAFAAAKQLYLNAMTSGAESSKADKQAMHDEVERIADNSVQFALKLRNAMQPGSGKRYDDLLAIVNEHVQLIVFVLVIILSLVAFPTSGTSIITFLPALKMLASSARTGQ